MKVLIFNWKDRKHPQAGGAEVVTEELATRLATDGHDVLLLVAGFPGAKERDMANGYRIVRVGGRFTVYVKACLYYIKHLRGWADVVLEEVNTIPFFTRFYVSEPRLLFFHQLAREIWFYQMPAPISWLGFCLEPLYLRLLANQKTITVSESTRQDLLRHGFGDVSIISEGIELTPVSGDGPQEKFAQPTLLSFGALRSMKRTLDHVRALEIAKKQIPNLQLKIAGDTADTYGHEVLQAIARSPFTSDIHVLGRVSQADKIRLMQRSHLLLVTSVKEGWCLVVTETASQGTPAVVYNVDGLRDSVKNGQTGLIVPQNPQALASGIVSMLQSDLVYQSMRHQALEMSRQFTFEQTYSDFLQVLGTVVPAENVVIAKKPAEGEV